MSQLEPMTCAEAEPLLPLVADGALEPDSDPALFAHLASCPACQRLVAQHDLIDLAIRQAGPVEAPRASIIRFWPYAAAACLALAAGLWLRAGNAERAAPAVPLAAAPSHAPAVPAPPVAQTPAAATAASRSAIAARAGSSAGRPGASCAARAATATLEKMQNPMGLCGSA